MNYVKKETFGCTQAGKEISLYTLTNSQGIRLTVSDFGAVITHLLVPDKTGISRDVVLGFDSLEAYEKNDAIYLGAMIGRNANRIAGARFELANQEYQLVQNDGENNLHSGPNGYHMRPWEVKEMDETLNKITFILHSLDGDQGYPGELTLEVSYQLQENGVAITYQAKSNETTIFNPTNHSYFNLNGHDAGSILNHRLQLFASGYTPMKPIGSIPTGAIEPVETTPFDFRNEKEIGREIAEVNDQLRYAKGYDHNFVLDNPEEMAAKLIGDQSGIVMNVTTNMPGVQLYTGNFISPTLGKNGVTYDFREGVCLETQYFPNAINETNFISPILERNQPVTYWTTYSFATEE